MRIKLVEKAKHQLTQYSTQESAGIDLRANPENDIILKPFKRVLVRNKLFMEIKAGYNAPIRTGRGMAINKGVNVLNSQETIHADNLEKICIILMNSSNEKFVIKDGELIWQMVIANNNKARLKTVEILLDSEREVGGFGHTGKN
jgi:dUTP pyrophosphatase